MYKKILAIILSLIIISIFIDILITRHLLQELPITRKMLFLEKQLSMIKPKASFVFSQSLTSLLQKNYYVLLNDIKSINLGGNTRVSGRAGTHLPVPDKSDFKDNRSINQSFSSLLIWWVSDKCWWACRETWLEQQRQITTAQQQYLFGSTVGNLVAAFTLGTSAALDPEVLTLFQALGLQHVLAPSGYNLGLFIVILSIFLPASLPRVTRTLLLCIVTGYLVLLTGFLPSLVRAWTMYFFGVIAWSVTRRSQPASLRLGLTIVLLLFFWQSGAHTLSLQLSVAATLGIILYAPLVLSSDNFFLRSELSEVGQERSTLGRWKAAVLEYVWGTLAIGGIAQLWVAPLVLEKFGALQLFSPVTTLAIAWIFPLFLFFGLVVMIFSPIIALFPAVFHLLLLVPSAVASVIWSGELRLLVWLAGILPGPVTWSSVPSWFRWAWWGGLVGVRCLWWLGKQRQRTHDRSLV